MCGTIYMAPITLGGEQINQVIPEEVQKIITSKRYFVVENIKTARRYLRKMDRDFPIDESIFYELNKRTEQSSVAGFLHAANEGNDIIVMSEAGCPGVADPGAELVALAHSKSLKVAPLTGPSSILLTIMGSGFSGQEFTFHGYLPKDRKERIQALKHWEADTFRSGHTHLFMDTPFRNMNVLEDLLNELDDQTLICIASNLTCADENIKTRTAKQWRKEAYDLAKKPTMFAIGEQ